MSLPGSIVPTRSTNIVGVTTFFAMAMRILRLKRDLSSCRKGLTPLWTIRFSSTQNELDSRGGLSVTRYFVLAALLAVMPAAAQPVQPMPTASTPVADLLATAPHRDISNGVITARLATVDG